MTLEQEADAGQPPRRADNIAGVSGMKTSQPTSDPCVPQSRRFNEASGQVRSQTKFQACFAYPGLKGLLAKLSVRFIDTSESHF